ncbi:MAG TPA: zinc-binding protein, partial [Ruminococcus sp.]|nr:zinc-binding protein [Ruminococcus sp.]
IEFRLFRGTLKLNTLLATLQMVDKICETAMHLDDDDVTEMSWSEFMSYITEPRLIQYLKERRLYINEEISNEEEI